MAVSELRGRSGGLGAARGGNQVMNAARWRVIKKALSPLASLRLTVVLFALAIFLVLLGTLAQVDKGMWEVMDDYFTTWVCWVDFVVLLPRPWFPNWQHVPGGFFFPGGKLIGVVMVINLLSAHSVRFTVQTRGARLGWGLAVILFGIVLTIMVITSGHNSGGLQGEPPFEWETLWSLIQVGLALATVGVIVTFVWMCVRDRTRRIELALLVLVIAALGSLTVWLILGGERAYLGDSGMRILWQLAKGALVGGILLFGCFLVFKRRAGIVLLHGGVALLMFGQFYVGKYDVEEQMTIGEGQTARFAQDIRRVELAVIDRSDSRRQEQDVVTVVPLSKNGKPTRLLKSGRIQHALLPFDIKVVDYFRNSTVKSIDSNHKNLATQGKGQHFIAESVRPFGGAESGVDQASAYLRFTSSSGDEIGTYLLSQVELRMGNQVDTVRFDEVVTVGDKNYDIALRFQRNYKPYSIQLIDVRKDDYVGTNTPKNYSSDIRFIDESRKVNRETRIWMNNPLRYAGETFYQSGWVADRGREYTTLQVVRNHGWLIPYVACMIVAWGMLAQFSLTLVRFLSRLEQADEAQWAGWLRHAPVVGAVFICAIILLRGVLPTRPAEGDVNITGVRCLPVTYLGRVKPFDTLARNSLRVISERETFVDNDDRKQPAVKWLMDVVTHADEAKQHKVFRITNLEVLDTLGLQRRRGFRYAYEEFAEKMEDFRKQVAQARSVAAEDLTFYQKKLVEMEEKLQLYFKLHESYRLPADIGTDPLDRGNYLLAMSSVSQELEDGKVPMAVPTESGKPTWKPLATVAFRLWVHDLAKSAGKPTADQLAHQIAGEIFDGDGLDQMVHSRLLNMIIEISRSRYPGMSDTEAQEFAERKLEEMPPDIRSTVEKSARQYVLKERKGLELSLQNALVVAAGSQSLDRPVSKVARSIVNVFESYRSGNAQATNDQLDRVSELLAVSQPAEYSASKTRFETYFNGYAPFLRTSILYVIAIAVALCAWLGWSLVWPQPLKRAAFWIIVIAFALHTIALVCRIYISGRPPVTNLYSSAVFIGWGGVALALILELLHRLGIFSVVAAVLGFVTLLIAHFLAGDGETIGVLQAVLDTQFWLATHVLTVTLGYATTGLAGALGVVFILVGMSTPSLSPDVRRILSRSIYGVICFAIFFSFIGTVLGGLWADDSWGRFWGWDPKENGALIIVLWNALVLHARWGGLVRERGLAVLSIAGIIAVGWSWFGVNELNIGLHSYGFTEGVLRALGIVVALHLVLIIVGTLPRKWWWSYRRYSSDHIATD